MPKIRPAALAAALLLVACSPSPPPADTAATPPPAVEPAPAPAPAPVEPTPTPGPAPVDDVHNDPDVINFAGYGSAKFGATEQEVRTAWNRPLFTDVPDDPAACYYLFQDPRPASGVALAFMMEADHLVRYDVDSPDHAAPGDLVVGMTGDDVRAKFPGRVEEQPGKYDPQAKVLIVTPEDGSAARLVFELDAADRITSWRIGVPPQVHYVEGCS